MSLRLPFSISDRLLGIGERETAEGRDWTCFFAYVARSRVHSSAHSRGIANGSPLKHHEQYADSRDLLASRSSTNSLFPARRQSSLLLLGACLLLQASRPTCTADPALTSRHAGEISVPPSSLPSPLVPYSLAPCPFAPLPFPSPPLPRPPTKPLPPFDKVG